MGYYLWWMEACLGLQRRGHHNIGYRGTMPKCIEIYDLREVSLKRLATAIPGIRLFARALSVGQEHYPENLRKLFLVNAPKSLAFVWKICFSVLDARTKEKISIAGDINRS